MNYDPWVLAAHNRNLARGDTLAAYGTARQLLRSNSMEVTEQDVKREQERFREQFGGHVELREDLARNRVKSRRIMNSYLGRRV